MFYALGQAGPEELTYFLLNIFYMHEQKQNAS